MSDDADLRQLVLHKDMDEEELQQLVFSKAEAGSVMHAEKEVAASLIATCLRSDPKRRPQSVGELLKHAYFTPAKQNKLVIVACPLQTDHCARDTELDLVCHLCTPTRARCIHARVDGPGALTPAESEPGVIRAA